MIRVIFQKTTAAGNYSQEYHEAFGQDGAKYFIADGIGYAHYTFVQDGLRTFGEWREIPFAEWNAARQVAGGGDWR